MDIVPKRFPTISMTDKVLPIVIWMDRPEIVKIAIYDHQKHRISLRGAENLNTQILYESNDFIFEKGDDFHINRLYKGIGVFNHRGNLKTIQTRNHICHRM